MKIAILSDIHGNLTALEAVFEDMREIGVHAAMGLGDYIGYGPDSDAVVARFKERRIPSVIGNHEMPVVTPAYIRWFNPTARQSLEAILSRLLPETRRWIQTLPRFQVAHGARFVHGFPPAAPSLYLHQIREARLFHYFSHAPERICFVGHTHDLRLVSFDGTAVCKERLQMGLLPLDPQKACIVNAGSVGQPRDGNNNAKYVVWDPRRSLLEVRFVPYDIQSVADRILAAGLPEANARRLF